MRTSLRIKNSKGILPSEGPPTLWFLPKEVLHIPAVNIEECTRAPGKVREKKPLWNVPEHSVRNKTCPSRETILPEPNLLGLNENLTQVRQDDTQLQLALMFHKVGKSTQLQSPLAILSHLTEELVKFTVQVIGSPKVWDQIIGL